MNYIFLSVVYIVSEHFMAVFFVHFRCGWCRCIEKTGFTADNQQRILLGKEGKFSLSCLQLG
jgi:hypothetical protein